MSSAYAVVREKPEALVEPRRPDLGSVPRLLAILVTIGLADLTIYRGQGYTGLAVFFLGVMALLYLGKMPSAARRSSWIVAVMLMLLAARLLWFGSPLQVLAGIVLVVSFATALDGVPPYALAVFVTGAQTLVAGFWAFARYGLSFRRLGARLHRRGGLGIILPAVAFVLFSALFILANPDAVSFLGRRIQRLLDYLSQLFVDWTLRPSELIFWIAVGWIMAGLLSPVLHLSRLFWSARYNLPPVPAKAPLYGACRNTLATVIVLFGGYLAYEYFTLWKRDFPAGFYYAGYAHEGAAWLTVALALSTLILSLIFAGSILADPRVEKLRRLAWVWSLQNLLLSVAVYNRLFIYIDFNGLTRMRIVGLFGTSLVVAGFLLVVWKIARDKGFLWLIHRQGWALGIAIYLFAITPVDGIAVAYNVEQVQHGNESACMQLGVHDLELEGRLALPPLLDSTTPEIRDGVAALIAEQYLRLQTDQQRRHALGWTAYQFSDRYALERFEQVRDRWQPFLNDERRARALIAFHDYAFQWY